MKKLKLIFIVTLFISMNMISQTSNPDCFNGDAETGTLAGGWTPYQGTSQAPQNLNGFVVGFDPNRLGVHAATGSSNYFLASGFNIVPPMLSGGIDYYGGFAIPNQGTYCFRVGNNQPGGTTAGQLDLLSYNFVVTNNNKLFKFRYASVLQDGGHTGGENPWVAMYMTANGTTSPFTYGTPTGQELALYNNTFQYAVADVNNPYFKVSPRGGNVVYKDWQCVEYDLSAYVGLTLTFNFIARDCSASAHFGYAYLDGLCTNWPATAIMTLNKTTFCNDGQPVIMNAAASSNEDRYFVEVAECDAGGTYTTGGDVANNWYLGVQAPNNFNVSQFFADKGKKFKCGKYYKVKLAVMNGCALWNQSEQIIHFTCPPIDAGPDALRCCGEVLATDGPQIGLLTTAGLTYNWTSFPTGFTSTQAIDYVNPTTSTAYILTVTDANGCKATDSVIVKFKSTAATLSITPVYPGCAPCNKDKFLKATINNNDCSGENSYFTTNYPVVNEKNVSWYFIKDGTTTHINPVSNSATYICPNEDGIAVAYFNNGCTYKAVTYHVTKYNTDPPEILVPNAFAPNGVNTELIFVDYGPNVPLMGQGPAYGATDFELIVFDSFGGELRKITKNSLGIPADQCLKNGDIRWDGRDSHGDIVPLGVYNYRLKMKYCNGTDWSDVCFPGAINDPCIQWAWLFCTKHLDGCIASVTVVQ